jgi:hypothetical protein
MACRCAERMLAMRTAVKAMVHGDVQAVGKEAGFVVRTLAEDTRSGDLRRAAVQQLSRLRAGVRR